MMDPDQLDHIYVQVALGVAKEDAPWPLTAEEAEWWDRLAAEVAEAVERGIVDFEMPQVELPQLPSWVAEAPEVETSQPTPPPVEAAVTMEEWIDALTDAHNPYHDERGRFTHGPGGGAPARVPVDVEPISRSELSNPDTPRSRAVSREEFNRLAERGRDRLSELRRNAQSPTDGIGNEQKWSEVKDSSWDAVQEEWGGATINARTGEPIEGNPDVYAMSVKPPGMQSVRVPIGSDRAVFDRSMDEARTRFANELTYDQFHLGVFRDEDTGNIDLDPVLIVDNLGDVESIGAFTRAVGGAYNFADGNGYWPPHIEE